MHNIIRHQGNANDNQISYLRGYNLKKEKNISKDMEKLELLYCWWGCEMI